MNRKINLLMVLPTLLLASCSETHTVPEYVSSFLSEANKSYTLLAKEKEIVNRTDGSLLFENSYNYSILSTSGDNARIKETLSYTKNGETNVQNINFVKDSDGYVATEALNYKNEVVTKVYRSNNSKVIYDNEYRNPFSLLSKADFTYVEDGKYRLNDLKTSLFTYYLLGIDYKMENVYFNFTDEKIDTITMNSGVYDGATQDANTCNYIKIKYSYSTEIFVSDVGTTQIKGLSKQASRNAEKEAILKSALSELSGNYTITMNEHDRDEKANTEYDSIWYFNGSDKVYHRQSADTEVRNYDLYYKVDKTIADDDKLRYFDFNEETGKWDYVKPTYSQSYNVDPKTYDYFVLKCLDIAPELFKYDSENNKFVCDNSYVLGYMGNYLLPGSYAISYFTNGEGDKAEIFLNSSNKIKKIVVGYTYTDPQGYEIPRDMDMTFSNIGTTEIPDYVEA